MNTISVEFSYAVKPTPYGKDGWSSPLKGALTSIEVGEYGGGNARD
jgi:hypothetical protein